MPTKLLIGYSLIALMVMICVAGIILVRKERRAKRRKDR
ncbi:Loki-CTERM sorting domain-containing protein [Parasphingorhabdus litoris]